MTAPTPLSEAARWSIAAGLEGRVPTGEFEQHVPEGAGGFRLALDRRFG